MVPSTPPAVPWPVFDRLGDYEGTKKPEEELLQNLDMELFELINVPQEVDEYGRRLYNDRGHRMEYFIDIDGNEAIKYIIEDEEPDDCSVGYWDTYRDVEDPAVEDEGEDPAYDECGERTLYSVDFDGKTIVGSYETPHPNSVVSDYEEPQVNIPMLEFEQQRLAEFLAAQDEELPQFQSDRERIAAWIATSPVADDETEEMALQ